MMTLKRGKGGGVRRLPHLKFMTAAVMCCYVILGIILLGSNQIKGSPMQYMGSYPGYRNKDQLIKSNNVQQHKPKGQEAPAENGNYWMALLLGAIPAGRANTDEESKGNLPDPGVSGRNDDAAMHASVWGR